jgi:ATP-dependent Clp protease ATP-binding subunit ClpC
LVGSVALWCYFEQVFDNFSTRARHLVFAARFKAGERGAAVVDTNDFLAGLVLEDQDLLLKSLFPDVEENAFVGKGPPHVPFFSHELAEGLQTELEKSLPRSQPVPGTTEIPLSSSLGRVFDLAEELQRQFRHSHMEPLHFLAAILKEDSSGGAKLLRRLGVTLESVLSELSRAGEG